MAIRPLAITPFGAIPRVSLRGVAIRPLAMTPFGVIPRVSLRGAKRRGNPSPRHLTVAYRAGGDLFRLGFADPPPMGLTGPSSLENVHWTFSQAFGPPKGEGFAVLTAIPTP